jgi:hypothetical protein
LIALLSTHPGLRDEYSAVFLDRSSGLQLRVAHVSEDPGIETNCRWVIGLDCTYYVCPGFIYMLVNQDGECYPFGADEVGTHAVGRSSSDPGEEELGLHGYF